MNTGEDAVIELDSTFAEVQARNTNTQNPIVPTGPAGVVPITSISGGSSGFGASIVGALATLVSALTTKGDLYTYSTQGTRLPVAANDARLTSDSTQATGLKWIAASTGWTAWTGSVNRSTHVTYSGTASAGYVQAEVQAVMDKLQQQTEAFKALVDDLIAQKILKL